MFRNNKILLIILNLILLSVQGQERQGKYYKESYKKIYGLFESYPENDDRQWFLLIGIFIKQRVNKI